MSKFVINAPATFGPGTVLGLSDKQAAVRGHAVKSLGGGRYEVQTSVQFKVGESIGYEGELPKALGDIVVDEKKVAVAKTTSRKAREVEETE